MESTDNQTTTTPSTGNETQKRTYSSLFGTLKTKFLESMPLTRAEAKNVPTPSKSSLQGMFNDYFLRAFGSGSQNSQQQIAQISLPETQSVIQPQTVVIENEQKEEKEAEDQNNCSLSSDRDSDESFDSQSSSDFDDDDEEDDESEEEEAEAAAERKFRNDKIRKIICKDPQRRKLLLECEGDEPESLSKEDGLKSQRKMRGRKDGYVSKLENEVVHNNEYIDQLKYRLNMLYQEIEHVKNMMAP